MVSNSSISITRCMYAGGYYSSRMRSYLRYENPVLTSWSASSNPIAQQLEALQAALAIGSTLKRVVILPKFHCRQSPNDAFFDCPLNALIAIKVFDSQFGSFYRESSFLSNSKVPSNVRRNVTSRFDVVPRQSGKKQVVTSDALLKRFKQVAEPVLSLGMLYNVRINFSQISESRAFTFAVKFGFMQCDYRQQRCSLGR